MKHVTNQLQAWISGELDQAQTEVLEKHLAACPACAEQAAARRAVWNSLEILARPDQGPSLWPGIRVRTVGAGDSSPWFFGTGRWVRSSLAVAAVVAGLMVGVWIPGGQQQIGGEADALAPTDAQLETLWLSGTTWAGGMTAWQSDWLSVGLAESSQPDQEGE